MQQLYLYLRNQSPAYSRHIPTYYKQLAKVQKDIKRTYPFISINIFTFEHTTITLQIEEELIKKMHSYSQVIVNELSYYKKENTRQNNIY